MPWWSSWQIPSFEVGTELDATPLTQMATDLTFLDATPQLNSLTSNPLVANAPKNNAPNFLIDVSYQEQVTNSSGEATFQFSSPFPAGVLIVNPMPADGSGTGMTFDLIKGLTTVTGFTVQCHLLSSGNYILAPVNTSVTAQWIAFGF